MKGIVLAGGTGSRLVPLTKITNKHLLPIYDKPMIYYPIQTLVDAGIRDILVVTGGKNAGDFLRLLANGKHFGLKHIDYTYQEGEGGIADALALAEHFADGERICVILGDNIIEGSIRAAVDQFRQQEGGARILLKKVPDAERFGVAEIAGQPHRQYRREAQTAQVELRRDGHLHVRRDGVRQDQDAGAIGPRRTGDHRRQQRIHPRRHHEFLVFWKAGGPTPARSNRCCARGIWWRRAGGRSQPARPPEKVNA